MDANIHSGAVSDYTLKNLMAVENAAAARGPGLDARFARKHMESEHLGVSRFSYEPGYRTPFGHRHVEQEEAYVIVAGSGRAKLGETIVELAPWDLLRVAAPVLRAFEAGPDGLVMIAIGSDLPEGGDGEMIEGFWDD